MKKVTVFHALLLSAMFLLPQAAFADKKEEAMGIVKTFATTLKGELEAAMKAGGPVKAIEVCSEKAPAIASELSRASGGFVRRVSLKLRNPSDMPDSWERAVLEYFDQQAAGGADLVKLGKGEMVTEGGQKYFRFMKAIPTAEVCLTCHGATLAPEVASALDKKYPHDVARGYRAGMVRGAFSVKLPMK